MLGSIALAGSLDLAGVASMVAAGVSLADAAGAEGEVCPAGDAPVGTVDKSSAFAKRLERIARITAKVIVAKARSQRGPFSEQLPSNPNTSRISEAGAAAVVLVAIQPSSRSLNRSDPTVGIVAE